MLRSNVLVLGLSVSVSACVEDGLQKHSGTPPTETVAALGEEDGVEDGAAPEETPEEEAAASDFRDVQLVEPARPAAEETLPIVEADGRGNCARLSSSPFGTAHFGDVTDLSDIAPETRRIMGDLILGPDDDVESLAALRCIRSIRGTLEIHKLSNVRRISMPELVQVGAVDIGAMPNLAGISMPRLSEVESVSVADAPMLERIWMPRVTALDQGLALEAVPVVSLGGVLPGLVSAGGVSLVDLPDFEAFEHAPIDLDGGDVSLVGLDLVEDLDDFPFTSVGFIEVTDNAALTSTAGATVREGAGGAVTGNPLLTDLKVFAGVSSLASLQLAENASLDSLKDVADLAVVSGDLDIANHAVLREYDGIYGIQAVGGDLRITEASALSAEELTALETVLSEIAIGGELVVSAEP